MADSLKIPIALVTEAPYTVDVTVAAEAVQPEDVTDFPIGGVRVVGTLSSVGEDYLFRGRVQGHYDRHCDRCLEALEAPFDLEAVWLLEQSDAANALENLVGPEGDARDDGPGRITFSGREINLALPAWEEIVLGAPTKFLCSEECAGLCPVCGKNLNQTRCTCSRDEKTAGFGSGGFAGLADMFPELGHDRSEE